MNYTTAKAKLGNKASKKIDNNTYLVPLNDGAIGIKLHNTVVVTLFADGKVSLNSGGFHTLTTKDRLNKYGPISVWQKNYTWYCADGLEFYDGITFSAAGEHLPWSSLVKAKAGKSLFDCDENFNS